jgi:hypothetical protein
MVLASILIGLSGVFWHHAGAHELGILRVHLEELDSGRYLLWTTLNGLRPSNFPLPLMPPDCECRVQESSPQSAGKIMFDIYCNGAGLRPGQVITLPWMRGGALVFARWKNGIEANSFFPRQRAGIHIQMELLKAGGGGVLDISWRYIRLGIEHIILGIDHLLFVLGLLLLVRGPWMLVKTITAFTLAHSITLAFATLGYVNAPSNLIDALVAMSIVFVGAEIINKLNGRSSLSTRAPWLVAFAFGLLHGFGFAGALNALGLPAAEIPIALFTFNIGVEIGQLIFVAVFISVVWAFKVLVIPWPRWSRPIPAYIIGSLAAFWFFQRVQLLVQSWTS